MESAVSGNTLMTPQQLIERLALPEAWLRKRTNDGTVPALRIGNALFYNFEAVQAALLEAASKPSPKASPRRKNGEDAGGAVAEAASE